MDKHFSQVPNQNPSPRFQQRIIVGLGFTVCIMAAIYTFTKVAEDITMVNCDSCTQLITGTDNSTLNLVDGDVLCITSTGNFIGTINRNSGTDTARIVNEGTLNANSINFNRGINVVENYGNSSPVSVNYNSNAIRNIWYNYAGALLSPGTFNLQQSDGSLYNYGTFSPTTLNQSGGSEFINYATGIAQVPNWEVNASSVTNLGEITISPGLLRLNQGSDWDNQGKLEIADDLFLNNSSTLSNTDSLQIGGVLTLNSGSELTNTAPMEVYYMVINNGDLINSSAITIDSLLTINGAGYLEHSGTMSIGDNFTLGGDIVGPASGTAYGMIRVEGVSTSWGGANVSGNIDICDTGSPPDGLDTKNGTYAASVTHCVHTFSPGGGSFPVEFSFFEAHEREGRVLLNWETASETNNHFFTIERRTEEAFVPVGRVEGAGNSEDIRSYQFTDEPFTNGKVVYRVKQTDFDGGYAYSSSVEINLSISDQVKVELSPNPADEHTVLDIFLPTDAQAELEVHSIAGKSVILQPHSLKEGNQQIRIDLSPLQAGVYFVQMRNQAGSLLFTPLKLVKQ